MLNILNHGRGILWNSGYPAWTPQEVSRGPAQWHPRSIPGGDPLDGSYLRHGHTSVASQHGLCPCGACWDWKDREYQGATCGGWRFCWILGVWALDAFNSFNISYTIYTLGIPWYPLVMVSDGGVWNLVPWGLLYFWAQLENYDNMWVERRSFAEWDELSTSAELDDTVEGPQNKTSWSLGSSEQSKQMRQKTTYTGSQDHDELIQQANDLTSAKQRNVWVDEALRECGTVVRLLQWDFCASIYRNDPTPHEAHTHTEHVFVLRLCGKHK